MSVYCASATRRSAPDAASMRSAGSSRSASGDVFTTAGFTNTWSSSLSVAKTMLLPSCSTRKPTEPPGCFCPKLCTVTSPALTEAPAKLRETMFAPRSEKRTGKYAFDICPESSW